MKQALSGAAVGRLPIYLRFLKGAAEAGEKNISATALAKALGYGEVQVRKDLGAVSGAGKPRTGYEISELIGHLERFMGFDSVSRAVIVGAGKLGRALYDYEGFYDYSAEIVAAFDSDNAKTGVTESGKKVLPMSEFSDFVKRENVKIGIITVPAAAAQKVCDEMTGAGIRAIWNFAPERLKVPDDTLVQNENLALRLAVLSGELHRESTAKNEIEE